VISKKLSVGSDLGNVDMLQGDQEESKGGLQLRDSVQSAGKDDLNISKRQS
jgi:hypothetical protein